MKIHLGSFNVPKVVCQHCLGHNHTTKHRMVVGSMVMAVGVVVAKSAEYAVFPGVTLSLTCWGTQFMGLGSLHLLSTLQILEISMKISKILHAAADKYLSVDGEDVDTKHAIYSCVAVNLALEGLTISLKDYFFVERAVFNFLSELGLDICSSAEFLEFKKGKERQAARYNWLKFAALIAEEEGI